MSWGLTKKNYECRISTRGRWFKSHSSHPFFLQPQILNFVLTFLPLHIWWETELSYPACGGTLQWRPPSLHIVKTATLISTRALRQKSKRPKLLLSQFNCKERIKLGTVQHKHIVFLILFYFNRLIYYFSSKLQSILCNPKAP